MTQTTYRWDYRTSPWVRMGFWLLLILATMALNWAGQTEVKVYWQGKGTLEHRPNDPWLLRLNLTQNDSVKLQVGMPATVSWESFPRAVYGTSQGRVQKLELRDQGWQAFVILDSPVLQTPNQSQILQPGLRGSAKIVISRKKAVELLWAWLKGT